MKSKMFAAFLLLVGATILLSSCGGLQSTTESKTTPTTPTVNPTESETSSTTPTENQNYESARIETVAQLKRYDEETGKLSNKDARIGTHFSSEYYDVCQYPDSDRQAYNCFISNVDSGKYVTQSDLSNIIEGSTLEDAFKVLPEPLYTRYSQFDWHYVDHEYMSTWLVRPSRIDEIPFIYEVKTLFLTENGDVLEVIFAQQYKDDSSPILVINVVPEGFTIQSAKVYTCEEILNMYT